MTPGAGTRLASHPSSHQANLGQGDHPPRIPNSPAQVRALKAPLCSHIHLPRSSLDEGKTKTCPPPPKGLKCCDVRSVCKANRELGALGWDADDQRFPL